MFLLTLTIFQLLKNLKNTSLYRPAMSPTFRTHDPDLRYIFQLRLGLSHLRYHKKRHKFADTPSDNCVCQEGVEDNRHYCTHRDVLFETVEIILHRNDLCLFGIDDLVKLLLYGHPTLNNTDNRDLLLATLEYIVRTKRFCLVPHFPALRFFFLNI